MYVCVYVCVYVYASLRHSSAGHSTRKSHKAAAVTPPLCIQHIIIYAKIHKYICAYIDTCGTSVSFFGRQYTYIHI